jgi:uncharacterized protein (TIGR02466 family)
MIDLLFPSAVLRESHAEFLNDAKIVLKKHLAHTKPNIWNVCQSDSMFDEKLEGLLSVIAQTSFEMLIDQGYDMNNMMTRVSEFWGQEFLRNGQHVEHVHGHGAQITGFYFITVPKNGSMPIVFDPRPAKKQISLHQSKLEEVTYASEQVILEINPGDLMLFNSWLPHGFTRHETDEPFQFLHFNVTVELNSEFVTPTVEII